MRVELITPDIEAKVGKRLESFDHIYRQNKGSRIKKIFWGIIIAFFISAINAPKKINKNRCKVLEIHCS